MNARWQRFWLTWLIGLLMLAGLIAMLQMSLGGPRPVLAQAGTGVIRVAMSGTDVTGCGSTAAPCRTVQYAIDQAVSGDEIHVATGLYTDVSARYGITQVIYIEETITIQGGYTTTNWATPDTAAYPTVLSALGQGRVVYVTGNITPTLSGLRLTGGSAIGLGGYVDPETLQEYDGGGAVYAAYATLIITDCQIDTSGAEAGGGIALFQSPARIYNSAVLTNQAGYGGGLALGYSAAILDGNTIAANEAGYGGGMGVGESAAQITNNTIRANEVVSSGGGIALIGNPPATVIGNLVTDNDARWGGGLVISSSTAYVYSNTFMANTSTEVGGGINLDHCDARLVDNLVQANSAGHSGGGFFFVGSTAVLTGNRILSNTTDESGGGLYLTESPARLYGNAILSNSADYSGGGLKMRDSAAQLVNNTISANTSLGTTWDERGGGGVYLHESNGALLDGNRIVQNTAIYYGGGVYLRESATELRGNVVATNTVDAQDMWSSGGGGFYLDNSDGAILTDNTIAANVVSGTQSTYGGGLYLTDSDAQLTGNQVVSNVAETASSWSSVRGGGLYLDNSDAVLIGNSIMSNVARKGYPYGGGLYSNYSAPI
ncbi:MAG: right-handed parallel beta-helix repeat-containing protein, partial [Chloroflexota bacterium]|nr:right-handed parallel beta-helix repeat-containing protein [Chloroflexota bacterium]